MADAPRELPKLTELPAGMPHPDVYQWVICADCRQRVHPGPGYPYRWDRCGPCGSARGDFRVSADGVRQALLAGRR